VNSPKLSISSATFEGNTAADIGGALNLSGSIPSLSITASRFSANEAVSGGGLYASVVGPVSISKSTFERNNANVGAGTIGGAINVSSFTTLAVTGSTFSANTAEGSGGAIYAGTGEKVTISKSVFSNNTSGGQGGGVALGVDSLIAGPVTVSSSLFYHNVATTRGGGMIVLGFALAVTKSVLVRNFSDTDGAAIYTSASLTMTGSTVRSNINTGLGDAVTADVATVHGSCFEGNVYGVSELAGGGDLSNNWWGVFNGPDTPASPGPGDGYRQQGATAAVLAPWLTAPPACPVLVMP
jgi:predicted outer membrane repeat protein